MSEMDKKKLLKDVLDLCKQGKFKDCINIVHDIDGDINNKSIMAIIIACCSCVANSSCPQNISEGDLFLLMKYIVLYVKDINEADLLSYVQSLFHILKLFIKKKCYRLIARMSCILIPSFLPLSLPKKHSDTYQSTASVLHNFVIKVDCEDFDSLITICNILSEMYAKVSNISALLSTAVNCTIRLSNLSCPLQTLEGYYFNVLSLVKLNPPKVDTEENFKNFMSHFTLLYHSYFKEFDFQGATNVYNKMLEYGTDIFNNEVYVNVLKVMKFPLLLSPRSEAKLESLIRFKRNLSKLHSAEQKLPLGNKLHSLIYTVVVSYYKSVNPSEWCKFSEDCRLELLECIWEIGRFELVAAFSCPCKCLVEKNLYQAFSYSHYISILLEICVRQRKTTAYFLKDGANLLTKFCDDVKVLQKNKCEKWKLAWNTIALSIYNIGVHLYQNANASCLHYFHSLIKNYIRFESREKTNILKFSMVGSAFAAVCNHNIKDHKKCMALSALGMKLCPSQRINLITYWIKAKVSQRDLKTVEADEAQQSTLVSALKLYRKEIEFLIDDTYLLTVTEKIELLVFELEQYKKKWKSKVPMMSALKELCEIANINKIVEVIINIFGDCDLMLHEDVPKILQKTLKQYEEQLNSHENSSEQSTAILAILYFMHYKYCVKVTITENADDMERTKVVTQKSDEPPDAIPKDPSEECDIVSFYNSLNLSRYFGVMKYLNKSLELFATVIKENFDPNSFTKITSSMIYNLLVKISMEFRLHRYSVKSLQALQLALKVAQSENNACNIVWAIAFIIENSDLSKSYVKYLQLIADKQLDNIKYTSISNVKVVLTYYICKSRSLLYEDYKEAYRIFQKANELYDVQEDTSELRLIKSQLYLLHFKYVLMPCKFGIVDHRESTLLTIHLANTTIYEMYHSSKIDGSYEMSVLLDINEELVKLNHQWRSPREARMYCKETIILTQQLVLPIRCAYYLVYLAHADLRSSRYDDCHVKIDGLAEILCLKKYNVQVDQENKPPLSIEIDKNIIDLTNSMQEMVLDLPVPSNYKTQLSASSPTLEIQPFHLPSFTSHEEDCECFYCMSLEYQALVLEKTRLDALLNIKQNNFSISTDFFHGALDFYESCCKKYESTFETIVKYISYDLIPEFGKEMLVAYGYTLLDYSNHLMRTKNKTEALQITNKLIDLVSSRKIQHVYLYNDALFQKLGYITDAPPTTQVVDKSLEMNSLCPEINVVSTTPLSKHSKVTLPVQYSPHISPPKRRVKKCLHFNLSPGQDSFNNNKPQDKTPPVSKQPKTPAPKLKMYLDTPQQPKNCASINIYNDESKQSKKKVLFTDESCSSFTATAKTPVSSYSLNPDTGLRARTKLLTTKLRKSAKKSEVPTVCISDASKASDEAPSGRKIPSLRKNLFELEQGETKAEEARVAQGGAIRKSTRKRKV